MGMQPWEVQHEIAKDMDRDRARLSKLEIEHAWALGKYKQSLARIEELERHYTAACRRVALASLSVTDQETVSWAVAEIKKAIERTGA